MSKPDLKVVGEIKPPEYKDPVKMLRNLAEEIERGDYGEVNTLAIASFGESGLRVYGGGRDSDGGNVHIVLASAVAYLQNAILAHPGTEYLS